MHGRGPGYLKDMLQPYVPSRPLWSQNRLLLVVPTVKTKQGQTAFSYYAVQLWNLQSDYIKSAPTIESFKTRLKTNLFSLAFNWNPLFIMVHLLLTHNSFFLTSSPFTCNLHCILTVNFFILFLNIIIFYSNLLNTNLFFVFILSTVFIFQLCDYVLFL